MDEKELRIQIGDRIQEYRRLRDLTQDDIAYKLNISRQMVSKYERGEAKIGIAKAREICHLLNIPEDFLYADKEVVNSEFKGEMEIYTIKQSSAGFGALNNKKWDLVPITDKSNKQLSYTLDFGLKNIKIVDLYAVKLSEDNKILNAPKGAIVIVQYPNAGEIDLTKPIYVFLEMEIHLYQEGTDYDGSQKFNTKFLTKVVPVQQMNEDFNALSSYRTYKKLYKFTAPDDKEYYADGKTIKEAIKGIVKKVIIDY